MSTQEIVEVVGELVVDDGKVLGQHHGSQALAAARDMKTELASRLQEDEMHAMIWQQFRNAPQDKASYLVTAVEELLSADAALAQRLDALLEQYQRATQSADRQVDTGGGAYVGGSVSVEGGDFVGRDKRTVSITGDGNVVGDRSSATVTKTRGLDGQDLAALFDHVYQRIESRPPDPDVDKEELVGTVKKIQEEAAKGEQANPKKVERWLKTLGLMADDIVEVTAACLLNPAAGVATVIRKVAEKAKAEAAST
jgi:hypothetical protein